MADHPPNPDRTDQGDNSPAPASPQHDKELKEIAPTADKDRTEDQEDGSDVEYNTEVKEKPSEEAEEAEDAEEAEEGETKEEASAPPLPDEVPPPLPNEAPPGEDDGWEPVWDPNAQAFYFYNRFTGLSQWENPRVPEAAASAPGTAADKEQEQEQEQEQSKPPVVGGYNPAIHGDYDPTAPYAQQYEQERNADASAAAGGVPGMASGYPYEATGYFNRFTGRWQADSLRPENYNDENKSRRQMNAFFDVDAAANSHDGRSLRAERSAKKLSKKELKAFKDKRREKKEEKRRAWLRD